MSGRVMFRASQNSSFIGVAGRECGATCRREGNPEYYSLLEQARTNAMTD